MSWPLGSLYEKWSFFLDSDIVPDIFDESKPHKCHFGYDPKTCTCACCTAARKVAYAKRLLAEEEAVNLGFSKNIQRDGATFGSMSAPEPPPPPQESPREKQDRQRRERYKESEKAWAQFQANEAERKAKKQPPTYGNDPDFIKGYVEHSENKDLSGLLSLTPAASAVDSFNAAKNFIANPSFGSAAMIAVAALPGKAAENAIDAFDVAKKGGKHSGFYINNINRSSEELEKGVLKLQKQIDLHDSLIKNPAETMSQLGKGDWFSLDPRQQKALIEKKWPSDIARQKEQQDILKGILRGGNNE